MKVVTKHAFDASDADRLGVLGIEVVRHEVGGLVHQYYRLGTVSTESGAEIRSRGRLWNGIRTLGNDAPVGVVVSRQARSMKMRPRENRPHRRQRSAT